MGGEQGGPGQLIQVSKAQVSQEIPGRSVDYIRTDRGSGSPGEGGCRSIRATLWFTLWGYLRLGARGGLVI